MGVAFSDSTMLPSNKRSTPKSTNRAKQERQHG
jgi:hypothetical protein